MATGCRECVRGRHSRCVWRDRKKAADLNLICACDCEECKTCGRWKRLTHGGFWCGRCSRLTPEGRRAVEFARKIRVGW